MTETTSDTMRFASFADLQREHLELMRGLQNLSESGNNVQRERIALLVERVKKTGTILDGTERQAAQNILDYWSAYTVSLTDISEDWSLPTLLPFESSATKDAPSADVFQKRAEARKRLRLAATARLWKSSNNDGYLLSGTALGEASVYQDDPDVAELVRASRVYSRSRRR